jgi:hypothetical protein
MCSALDLEPIGFHQKYLGQRGMIINPTPQNVENHRNSGKIYKSFSLFKSKKYGIIHSDVNGAFNIGRLAFGNLIDEYIKLYRDNGREKFNPRVIHDLDYELGIQKISILNKQIGMIP